MPNDETDELESGEIGEGQMATDEFKTRRAVVHHSPFFVHR